jgi:hypothetical protein
MAIQESPQKQTDKNNNLSIKVHRLHEEKNSLDSPMIPQNNSNDFSASSENQNLNLKLQDSE